MTYIVTTTHIWRPGTGDGLSVGERLENRPDLVKLRDKLGMWWQLLNAEVL